MNRDVASRPVFGFLNPNKEKVVEELDALKAEWKAWQDFAETLGKSAEYDPKTCTEAIMDGSQNKA